MALASTHPHHTTCPARPPAPRSLASDAIDGDGSRFMIVCASDPAANGCTNYLVGPVVEAMYKSTSAKLAAGNSSSSTAPELCNTSGRKLQQSVESAVPRAGARRQLRDQGSSPPPSTRTPPPSQNLSPSPSSSRLPPAAATASAMPVMPPPTTSRLLPPAPELIDEPSEASPPAASQPRATVPPPASRPTRSPPPPPPKASVDDCNPLLESCLDKYGFTSGAGSSTNSSWWADMVGTGSSGATDVQDNSDYFADFEEDEELSNAAISGAITTTDLANATRAARLPLNRLLIQGFQDPALQLALRQVASNTSLNSTAGSGSNATVKPLGAAATTSTRCGGSTGRRLQARAGGSGNRRDGEGGLGEVVAEAAIGLLPEELQADAEVALKAYEAFDTMYTVGKIVACAAARPACVTAQLLWSVGEKLLLPALSEMGLTAVDGFSLGDVTEEQSSVLGGLLEESVPGSVASIASGVLDTLMGDGFDSSRSRGRSSGRSNRASFLDTAISVCYSAVATFGSAVAGFFG
jgi:hypothetical protein